MNLLNGGVSMPKVSTNINLDAGLTTTVTIFLNQTRRIQGIPFLISRGNPNAKTIAALNEYEEMKNTQQSSNGILPSNLPRTRF